MASRPVLPFDDERRGDESALPLVVRRSTAEEVGSGRGMKASVASMQLSGVFATSQDAVRRRLLGPWAIGLRQYIALRLGDPERAHEAFRELRRWVSAMPTAELVREPGPKAHVYRIARRIALEAKARHAPKKDGGDALPLRFRAPANATRHYADALERVRSELDPLDAELVELRYARELSPIEIACVLELSEDAVVPRLQRAVERARMLLGAHAPGAHATRGGPLVDVFALAKGEESPTRTAEGDALTAFAPGTLINHRYRIVQRVGIGAFGDVYKADDADVPGHRIALKILREPSLSEAARESALRELKLIAAVFHPSVVQFKDHGWHEDRLWFVMPWYEGETLERRMERGPLSRAEARRIFEPLARALATLHANGIRHQDVKPDNVFLARIKGFARDGEEEQSSVIPVLLDLGVAAKEHEALIGGTPVYFAPEVAAHYANLDDERYVGPKADVFGLALSLRNALEPETEDDVPGGAIEAFIERRAKERPSPPLAPELRWLGPYFDRWLAIDPEQRPTAEEFARELAILTRPEERRARIRMTAQWLVPAVLALAAVFSAVVYVFVRENQMKERLIDEARTEAAEARADLMVEAARLEALDADHANLLARYEQGRLTRQELADQLATSEGQITILGDRIAQLIEDRETLSTSLSETHEQLVTTNESLSSVRRQLDTESQRARDLGRYVDELRADSDRIASELEGELDSARARVSALEDQLDQARSGRREAMARVEELEDRLSRAEVERARAIESLSDMRRRVAQLREILEPSPRRDTNREGPSAPRAEPPLP